MTYRNYRMTYLLSYMTFHIGCMTLCNEYGASLLIFEAIAISIWGSPEKPLPGYKDLIEAFP